MSKKYVCMYVGYSHRFMKKKRDFCNQEGLFRATKAEQVHHGYRCLDQKTVRTAFSTSRLLIAPLPGSGFSFLSTGQ